MTRLDTLLSDLKRQIVETLGLDDVEPTTVDDDALLFGPDSALELDSIDALELVVLLEKHYGIRLKDMESSREAFRSVRTLAEFVQSNQPG